MLASLATLSLGAVLGPEAPLIAIGGGLAALTVRLLQRDAPPMALTIMASAGSFAAISTLLGSPLLGAFLIMEVAGVSGVTLSLVALRDSSRRAWVPWSSSVSTTGPGSASSPWPSRQCPLSLAPTVACMGWALVIGVIGALLGWGVRSLGLALRPVVHLNRVLVTMAFGALIGLMAMTYQLVTGPQLHPGAVLGPGALPGLVAHAADYSVGALVMLAACKMLAYGISLSAFRGGPIFPAMFIGATLGIALSGLPGLTLAPAIAAGIGAMCAAMLRLPLTSALLATLLLGSDGVSVTPQVVVAVVVAFVLTMVLPVRGAIDQALPA